MVLAEMMTGLGWFISMFPNGIPKNEHPRPDWFRSSWVCLNGVWSFSFDEGDRGIREKWYASFQESPSKILVPFPWESPLSGVGVKTKQTIGWYQRFFELPKDWRGKRIWLCFGAVDWKASVWVNGHLVGDHVGGYSEFRFEVTDYISFESANLLVVRAEDHTDKETPIGKQVEWWYTSASGIWQTVWMEATGDGVIERWQVFCQADEKGVPSGNIQATIFIRRIGATKDRLHLTIQSSDRKFQPVSCPIDPDHRTVTVRWRVPDPQFWSPESPRLYPVRLILRKGSSRGPVLDTVETYFGIRDIRWALDSDRQKGILLLNGRPLFLRGALDQSFNPWGIYTSPSDEFLREDVEKARSAGFNMLRIHIKIDEPRKIYWADRLGMLIQYDFPSFYAPTSRARALFEKTVYDAIARDFNHPSIFCWTIFNEEWGIGSIRDGDKAHRVDWVEEMFHKVRNWDPTRLVQDNTGWAHLITDLNSFHWYGRDVDGFRLWVKDINDNRIYPNSDWNFIAERRSRGEPFVNNEFGYVAAGDGDGDWSWGVLQLINALSSCDRLIGFTYTELTDIEWEHNGVYNYDRSEKECGFDFWAPGMGVRDLFGPDFLVLDVPSIKKITLEAQQASPEIVVPVLFRYSSGTLRSPLTLRWQWRFLDRFGRFRNQGEGSRKIPTVRPFRVHRIGEIRGQLPDEPGLLTLVASLSDRTGQIAHINYTQWWIRSPDGLPTFEAIREDGRPSVVLRFRPTSYTESRFSGKSHPDIPIDGKHYGTGAGFVTYEMDFPKEIDVTKVESIAVRCEIAAKAERGKVDWSHRVNPQDYPQTDGKKFPTTVMVLINDVPMALWDLPDDPADARGVLSHWSGVERGSYGYLMEAKASANSPVGIAIVNSLLKEKKLRLRFEVPENAVYKGGLAIYGETMGFYAMEPL